MREGQRPVAEHILAVLMEHKGKGLRFRDLKMEMAKKGHFHVDSSIVQNYQWLVKQGKIIKDGLYYAVPIERGDGTGYFEIEKSEVDKKTVEVWKVKPDAE